MNVIIHFQQQGFFVLLASTQLTQRGTLQRLTKHHFYFFILQKPKLEKQDLFIEFPSLRFKFLLSSIDYYTHLFCDHDQNIVPASFQQIYLIIALILLSYHLYLSSLSATKSTSLNIRYSYSQIRLSKHTPVNSNWPFKRVKYVLVF